MDRERNKGPKRTIDKNPYNKREDKITDKAFKSVAKSVEPLSKEKNTIRRKRLKPT